jgi:hypothetical protein
MVGMLGTEIRRQADMTMVMIRVGGLINVRVVEMEPHGDMVVSLIMMDMRDAGEGAESQPESATTDCQHPSHVQDFSYTPDRGQ